MKWAHGLNSGIVSPEDISYLKESLLSVEFAILPTVLDKWVSLHPSFGLVCWCDDENLRKEFKHSQKIDFLYFGELSNFDEDMRESKFSILIQTLGIPALSQVRSSLSLFSPIPLTLFSLLLSLSDKTLQTLFCFLFNAISDEAKSSNSGRCHPCKYVYASFNMYIFDVMIISKNIFPMTVKGNSVVWFIICLEALIQETRQK